jgi:O-antigen/teichoic acid export membrane protein
MINIGDFFLFMKLRLNSQLLSGFKLELLASFAGTGWSGLIQLACIPAYIKFMGIEAYGLIGFYVVLQAMLQVLDLGLSPTMNREMARYSVQPEKGAEARDLVRTLEIGYWLIGLIIGTGILAASHWLAVHWIRASAVPERNVTQAVMLMGLLAVFQWPVSFYQGGLMGLRQQVPMNALRVTAATVNNMGGVLILWLVSPTIQAFLVWQVCINVLNVSALAVFLWKKLPASNRAARFDLLVTRKVLHFAAGMTGIAIISLVLTQADKILVSKLFSLKMFGYYALAWSLANIPLVMAGCVFSVVFPQMSSLVSKGDQDAISRSYHRGSQLMAVLILPAAAVCSLFSFELLRLWTANSETAAKTALIVSVLMLGSALNALLYLPYALQLAFGWTKLPFLAGVVSISILVPLMFPMTKYFGLVGAASIWVLLNVLNMFITVPLMHRRLLRRETWKYFSDIGLPLLGTLMTVTIGRFLFTSIESRFATLAALTGLWLVSFSVAVLLTPYVWEAIRQYFSKLSPSYV